MSRIVNICVLSLVLGAVAPFGSGVLLAQTRPTSQPATEATAPENLADLLEPVRAKFDLPGLAGAIVHGTRTVGIGVAGVRARGSPEKAAVEDRWHLGSCTKSMTATLIARLIEQRKLKFDTTLGRVFPEFAAEMNPKFREVTIEQLLCHRAGIPSDLSFDGLWGALWKKEGTPTAQRLKLMRAILVRPPETEPGSTFLYANAGFAIAGACAEKITGKAWEDLMRDEIFTPLGMTSAGFGAPGDAKSVSEPRGHSGRNPVPPGPEADNPPAIGPGGTVHCSIGDWAKYVSAHLIGERGDSALLDPRLFTSLHTPRLDPAYVCGWGVTTRPWSSGRIITHSGSNNMWFSVVWIALGRDFAVLVTSNEAGDAGAKGTDAAAWALIEHHIKSLK